MNRMMKMAYELIKNKKRWNLLIIILLAVLYASCFLVNDVFLSTESSILNLNMKRHGAHHGIFFDVDQKEIKQSDKDGIKEDGWIGLLGTYHIKNKQAQVSVGFFDHNALKMNPLQLAAGRLPQNQSEIAVEQSKLKKFGDTVTLGSQVMLISERNIARNYTICGVIKDYTGAWDVPDFIEAGENSLPEVFVCEDAYVAKHFHYIFQCQFLRGSYDSNKIYELAERMGVNNDEVVCNQKTYVDGMNVTHGLKKIQLGFLMVIIFAILIFEKCCLPVYYHQYKKAYDTFYLCGMKQSKQIRLKTIHYLLLMLMVMIGTLILYFGSSFLIQRLWMKSYIHHVSAGMSLIAVVVLIIGFYWFAFSERKKEEFVARVEYQQDKGLLFNLFRLSMKRGWKIMIPCIAVSVTVLLMVFYAAAYLHDYDWGDWNSYPDFSMAAETTSISIVSGKYEIYQNRGQYFSYHEISELEQMQGISRIRKIPYTDGLSLNLKKSHLNDYWKKLYTDKDEMIDIVPEDDTIPIYDLNYYILNKKEVLHLMEKYPNNHLDDLLQKNSIALYLPKYQETKNPSVIEGMNVTFGKIRNRTDKDLAKLTRDDVWQQRYPMRVSSIIYSPIQIGTGSTSEPAVLIWEENAKQMIDGYHSVDAFLKKNVSRGQYQAIQKKMESMAAMHTDFLWLSKMEQEKEAREVQQTILIPVMVFAVEMTGYLLTLLLICCLMYLKQIEDEICTFWIYGTGPKQIKNLTTLDIGCCGMISFLGFAFGTGIILWIYSAGMNWGYGIVIEILSMALTGLYGICIGVVRRCI